MRLLLDECVPKRLRRELPGHEISTVVEMGWSGKRNGELLKLMVTNGFVGFLQPGELVRVSAVRD